MRISDWSSDVCSSDLDAAEAEGRPEDTFRTVPFRLRDARRNRGLIRPVRRFPFVPNRRERLDEDCYEAFNIQVDGLMRRLEATGAKSLVIGISGGLDSTHALIVAAKCCDRLGLPRSPIRGYTMPGFGTSAIGSASCGERGCKCVWASVGAGSY